MASVDLAREDWVLLRATVGGVFPRLEDFTTPGPGYGGGVRRGPGGVGSNGIGHDGIFAGAALLLPEAMDCFRGCLISTGL